MAWIETLCMQCDKPHLTDLDTLTNDFVRKSGLTHVGTHWRYCKEHSFSDNVFGLKLELEDSAKFRAVVGPIPLRVKDGQVQIKPEPNDVIDHETERKMKLFYGEKIEKEFLEKNAEEKVWLPVML